jgi:hypothetical protein
MGKGEMAKIGGEMAKGKVGKGEMGINHKLHVILECLFVTAEQFIQHQTKSAERIRDCE